MSPQKRPAGEHKEIMVFPLSENFRLKTQVKQTFEGSLPPEPVSDLNVVVPTQVTPEEVHGSKIQNNLRHGGDRRTQRR